jgi:hypothetical protein
MSDRHELIHKAASLPVGDPERKALLARIKSGGYRGDHVYMYVARGHIIQARVRLALSSGMTPQQVASQAKVAEATFRSVQRTIAGLDDYTFSVKSGVEFRSASEPPIGFRGPAIETYWAAWGLVDYTGDEATRDDQVLVDALRSAVSIEILARGYR